jgi:hypothetical protein
VDRWAPLVATRHEIVIRARADPSARDQRHVVQVVHSDHGKRERVRVVEVEVASWHVPWKVRLVKTGGAEERLRRIAWQEVGNRLDDSGVGEGLRRGVRQRAPIEKVIGARGFFELLGAEQAIDRPVRRERISHV